MHQIFTGGCESQSPSRSSVFIFLHYLKIFPFYFFILHYKCVRVLFILFFFFLAFVGACSFLKLPLFDLFQVESLYLEQYVRSECIIFINFLSLSSMLPPFLGELSLPPPQWWETGHLHLYKQESYVGQSVHVCRQ